jgi:hypothetical protein
LAVLEEAGTLSLIAGAGDGSFRRPIPSAVVRARAWIHDIYAADVIGDGSQDVVVSGRDPRGSVGVLINDGRGRFHRDQVYVTGEKVWATVVADVNGDGLPDIVMTHRGVTDFSVLLGTGAGRFGPPKSSLAPAPPSSLSATSTVTASSMS